MKDTARFRTVPSCANSTQPSGYSWSVVNWKKTVWTASVKGSSNLNAMHREKFLEIFCDALSAIREPRLYSTERGYQGALIAQLTQRMPTAGFEGSPIIEQEYQKRFEAHGITIRPDLIIHVPFERKETATRVDGNFVAVEIKLHSSATQARDDFVSLTAMKEKLGYPITIFLNLDSSKTYVECCPRGIADQTTCFAVTLRDGVPEIVMEQCSELG